MNVSRAQVSNLADEVVLDDPAFPYRVRVRMGETRDLRPAVTELAVQSRSGEPITAGVLAKIPVRQIAGVAASVLHGDGNESQFRMLAQPRPEGSRSWPDDHYKRVRIVAKWARSIGREGGEVGTVAQFWGVNPRTARRWLQRA